MRKFAYMLLLVSCYLAKVVYAEEVVLPDVKLSDDSANKTKQKQIGNISVESANMEDRKAWKINGLRPRWYTLWMKPLSKIVQLFKKAD